MVGSMRKRSRSRFWVELEQNWRLLVLALPALVWLVTFMYAPMYGVLIAFKEYMPKYGIAGSPWAEPVMKYFHQFFSTNIAGNVIRNTLMLGVLTIICTFPLPIMFALLLNQLKHARFKKTIQTISYAPYFVSTVVVVGMMMSILSAKGFVNAFLGSLGMDPVLFMSRPEYFRATYIISGVWQGLGFNSIIYVAALTGINPEYYEAAEVDGATKIQRVLYIDIPHLMPTAVIMLILSISQVMTVSYEKVYLMQTGINISVTEVISTYVYKVGLLGAQFSYATAIGLFNSIVNFALILFTNGLSKKLTGINIY